MKTLLCGLAAILSVAVSSPVLAISDDGLITGTVVEYTEINAPHYALVVEDSKKERFTINARLANQRYQPKVGDKVTVHYHTGRHGVVIKSQPKH
jgi:hypothetical protein